MAMIDFNRPQAYMKITMAIGDHQRLGISTSQSFRWNGRFSVLQQ